MVLFNLSTFQSFENEDFVEIFKRQCGMDWKDALSTLPQAGYVVYLVLDEAQGIYSDGKSSPRRKSSVFWEVVKAVLNNAAYSVRILMFAAYGFGVQYVQWSTPVQLDARFELGIDHLKFSRAEVFEYITKWFDGVMCFEGSQSALEEFCSSGSGFPSPVEWIHMLQRGSLYRDSDSALFNRLIATRAVKVLETLDLSELDRLDRIAYGAQPNSDAAIVEHCIRKGILTQTGQRVEFSSPVMWRYFVKMRVGHIERALHDPHTLPDMIAGVMRSIDYDSIRQTLVRSLSINIPLESAWQMEFCKATYRCTRTIDTSVDVGALFGSIGFIDFTVRQGDNFWGIELLREGSNLAEHNFPLTLTDFCLIDFRRVDSIDNVEMESIAADMHRCEKLFVVCYDARVADVVVFNSAMDIVYRKVLRLIVPKKIFALILKSIRYLVFYTNWIKAMVTVLAK